MPDQGSSEPRGEEKEQNELTHNTPSMSATQPRFQYPGGDLPYGPYGPIDSETRDLLDRADLICS